MSYLEQRRAHIENGRPLPEKKPYRIPKKSKKRILKETEIKESGKGDEKEKWFQAQRPKMTGTCLFCGGKTEKYNDKTFRNSIAHLLPKKNNFGFPSVALHPDNWIELCFYGNSCHKNFDNGIISWEFLRDSKEWEIIKEQLLIVLPAAAERKHKLYLKLIELIIN